MERGKEVFFLLTMELERNFTMSLAFQIRLTLEVRVMLHLPSSQRREEHLKSSYWSYNLMTQVNYSNTWEFNQPVSGSNSWELPNHFLFTGVIHRTFYLSLVSYSSASFLDPYPTS